MDCTGSTRARLGSMPAHKKQIRGSVQANPLAQGLTEGGGAALVPADPEGAEDRQWDSGASMKGKSIGHLDPSPGSPAVH